MISSRSNFANVFDFNYQECKWTSVTNIPVNCRRPKSKTRILITKKLADLNETKEIQQHSIPSNVMVYIRSSIRPVSYKLAKASKNEMVSYLKLVLKDAREFIDSYYFKNFFCSTVSRPFTPYVQHVIIGKFDRAVYVAVGRFPIFNDHTHTREFMARYGRMGEYGIFCCILSN